ncbi:hypothetical protein QIH93_27485 [Bradyrhizobium ottawaense]|nr:MULTISPECIES: hypothetical protein [Bradyrhizobium]WLB44255.1 hypothetical protein QIH93_27485 [Bradyrhizobium ottawaense]BBO03854.1 hypothetical protein SG09_32040 [Bradyrhizobium ottawaense]GMO13394.1 hypothetical protein BwSH14_00030 [Bradyrhizobium ottawaense]GMO45975.1 hypothetical protein BwSF21_61920 [Bradyrhizobium ottawaense]GMO49159.1 hypothetical protein BwSF12_57580 [Bradyrhizobium ottawaense]
MLTAKGARRRFKQQTTLEERLATWTKSIREQAAKLPPGPDRDALIKKVLQAETGERLNNWLTSPELQPPK